jgi:hypothetical protein
METVTQCQPSGKEWNGKIIYSIGLSDGRGGESFSQIAVGTSVNDLLIEQSNYGLKIKKKQPAFTPGFQGKRSGNESFALSYSKDLVVGGKVDIKDILTTADKLYNWLEKKKSGNDLPMANPVQPTIPQVQNTVKPNHNPSNDLPF